MKMFTLKRIFVFIYLNTAVTFLHTTCFFLRFNQSNNYFLLRNYNPVNLIALALQRNGNNFVDDLTIYPAKSNLKTPTVQQAEHFAHFAAASYCNGRDLEDWVCVDCVKTKVEFAGRIYNYIHNTMAYFAIDNRNKEIILTFRGTLNIMNFLQTMTVELIPVSKNKEILVHRGAWDALMSLAKDVEGNLTSILDTHPKYNKLTLVGHSFGGLLATLALYNLKTNPKFADLDYSLYTYGTPRTGNLAFALWVNSQVITAARVVNNRDFISHYTTSQVGYVHHMGELWLSHGKMKWCSKKMLEDPNCSNSLGPAYSPFDHLFGYWNLVFPPLDCMLTNPVSYVRDLLRK